MLIGYKVKFGYSEEFFFDSIEEAGVFFDKGIRHSETEHRWASIEPVYDHPEEDASEEDTDD